MPASTLDLSFDVDHHIASYLNVRDYTSLSQVNRHFRSHLQDDRTARQCVQLDIPYSRSGQAALLRGEQGAFRKTVSQAFDCKEAMRTAAPYSASILAYATSFCNDGNVICYSIDRHIRILDLANASKVEKVISGEFFTRTIAKPEDLACRCLYFPKSLSVLGYGEGIVTVLCDFGVVRGQYLFAVNIADRAMPSESDQPRPRRVLLKQRLRSTCKLFVCHTAEYLIYGTHSAVGANGHHEWLLYTFNLTSSTDISAGAIQLANFVGSEIGSTVCFQIHNNDFYALTNQTSYETEEVDWTSYYHYVRFPIASAPSPDDLKIKTIYRRQHLEGPINDAWTDLGFQRDDTTGELLIVESRKEWLGGSSSSERTYYIEPFERARHGEVVHRVTYPPNDPLARTLESSDRSRWEASSKPRIEKYMHREFGGGERSREYLRAKTKWIGYHYNTSSFVDLVVEEVAVAGVRRPAERLKVRVVSRLPESPIVEGDCGWKFRSRPCDGFDEKITDDEDISTESEIFLWPEGEVPGELDEILCPGGRAEEVKAVLSDYGIVYMVGPPRKGEHGERALVFVSFDPSWGFEGMKRLDGTSARPRTRPRDVGEDGQQEKKRKSVANHESEGRYNPTAPSGSKSLKSSNRDVDQEEANLALRPATSLPLSLSVSEPPPPPSQSAEPARPPLLWKEEAAHASIARAFWLR